MLHDLRYAIRSLRRSPAFAAAAVLTLGLGAGLNIAIFGIVNNLLFRKPAVHDPEGLVWVSSDSRLPGGPHGNLTNPDIEALRSLPVFSGVIGYAEVPISIGTGRQAARVTGQIVNGDLFGVLGVTPAAGRAFGRAESVAPGRGAVAVIGHGLWQRLFGGDPEAVGRTVAINGQPFEIVAIAPPGFAGPDVFTPADLWVPLSAHARAAPRLEGALTRQSFWLRSVARLAPSATRAQARSAVAVLARTTERDFASTHRGFELRVSEMSGLGPHDRANVAPASAMLLAVTFLVLLLACANVASLLLARGAIRSREIGVRLALGGSRGRIARQLLVESALLAAGGGAAGLFAALWGTDALIQFAQIPIETATTPDGRVLAFTAAIALVTTFLFGLLPAVRASGLTMVPALRSAPGAGVTAGAARTQRALVAAQLAVSLVLLAGAGLLLRSLAEARRVEIGFETADRYTVGYDLALQGYSDERARAFSAALAERIRAIPGVAGAALATAIPGGDRVFFNAVFLPGRPVDPDALPDLAGVNEVTPGFFELMGIKLVAGRAFVPADAVPRPAAAIVSEAFASRFWPGQRALGRRVALGAPDGPPLEVVGIVRDALVDHFTDRTVPFVYTPYTGAAQETALLVAVPGGFDRVAARVLGEFARLDADLPAGPPIAMAQHVAGRLDGARALSKVLGVTGALALLLAAFGVYSVAAQGVVARMREVGVRIALGASARDVLRMFLRESARLVAAGVACGLPLAVAVSAAVKGQLVGVGTGDPLALSAAAAVLAAAALAAAYVPARRALLVDPAIVLRAD